MSAPVEGSELCAFLLMNLVPAKGRIETVQTKEVEVPVTRRPRSTADSSARVHTLLLCSFTALLCCLPFAFWGESSWKWKLCYCDAVAEVIKRSWFRYGYGFLWSCTLVCGIFYSFCSLGN